MTPKELLQAIINNLQLPKEYHYTTPHNGPKNSQTHIQHNQNPTEPPKGHIYLKNQQQIQITINKNPHLLHYPTPNHHTPIIELQDPHMLQKLQQFLNQHLTQENQ